MRLYSSAGTYIKWDWCFAAKYLETLQPAIFGEEQLGAQPVNLGYAPLAIKAWGISEIAVNSQNLGEAPSLKFEVGEFRNIRFFVRMASIRASALKPSAIMSSKKPSFRIAETKKPSSIISSETN
jgi:hypothetical protein